MSEQNKDFIEENPVELPRLSTQQNLFVRYYAIENMSGTEAYRLAYNSKGSTRSCCVEASRLLKNPNITLWIDFIQKTQKEHIRNEIKYSIDDAMKELDDLKIIALESLDQYSRPNVSAATKAVEMKCKLKGLMSDDATVNNSVVFTGALQGTKHLINNSAVGSAIGSVTKPVYIDSTGTAYAINYSIEKNVPSNAEFTDTKVTQTLATASSNYPILLTPANQTVPINPCSLVNIF